jgi:tetratricopeptide (TPR) repeat protein
MGSPSVPSSSASSQTSSSASSTHKNLSPADHVARGVKFSEQGKRREAIVAYSAALKLDPNNLSALLYRAGEEYAMQELEAAERDVTQALKLDPTYAEGYILRAHLWGMKHDYQRAVDDFYTALKHPEREAHFAAYFGDKKDVVAHVYLAAAYSECPDIDFRDDAKAFQHAMQACQLDNWQNRRYVSLLVNAIAGAKTQEAAVERQQQAIAAAPTDSLKQVLEAAVEAFDIRSEFPLR